MQLSSPPCSSQRSGPPQSLRFLPPDGPGVAAASFHNAFSPSVVSIAALRRADAVLVVLADTVDRIFGRYGGSPAGCAGAVRVGLLGACVEPRDSPSVRVGRSSFLPCRAAPHTC